MLPPVDGTLDLRRETGAAREAHGTIQVLPLDVEGAQLSSVGQLDLASAGHVVGDLPDRPYRVLQGEIPEDDVTLDHLQQGDHGPDLDEGGVLAHVRVACDDVQTSVTLGVGMGLVPRVDYRAGSGCRRRHPLPDVVGPLGY